MACLMQSAGACRSLLRHLPGDDASNDADDDQNGDQYAAHQFARTLLVLFGIHQSGGPSLDVLHGAGHLQGGGPGRRNEEKSELTQPGTPQ